MTEPPVREHGYFARNYSKIQKGIYVLLFLALGVAAVLVIIALFTSPDNQSYPFSSDRDENIPMVSVTVTGAVRNPGTFQLQEGSTVYDALVLAGVRNSADLGSLILEQRFANSENFVHVDEMKRIDEPAGSLKSYIVPLLDGEKDPEEIISSGEDKDEVSDIASLNVVNILYIGAPHVFMLASIAPGTGNGSILVIPPQTRVAHPTTGGGNQLSHLYLLGGAGSVVTYVESLLQLPVHFFIEDKQESFITTIELLGGFRVKLDEEMAELLEKEPGYQTLTGMESFRFIQYFGLSSNADTYKRSTNLRILRWRRFLDSAYVNFRNMDWRGTILLARHIILNLETNLELQDILYIARNARAHGGFNFDFRMIQGSYQKIGNKVYWEINDSIARIEGLKLIETVLNR